MKTINLTKGKVAIVDDEDYKYLLNFHWQAIQKNQDWYAVVSIRTTKKRENMFVYMHEFLTRTENVECITFRNKNTLDNRRENLVPVSRGVSITRTRKRRTNGGWILSSIYKGVSHRVRKRPRRKTREFWEARISKDGKTYWLGMFKSAKDAAETYNKKSLELYGEMGYQNKIK